MRRTNHSSLKDKIINLLKNMTLEEKIGQLVQFGSFKELEKQLVHDGEIGSLLNFCGSSEVSDIQREIMRSKCKVPLLIGDDVIHGYKTGFPIPLAESCSFDLELIEETAAVAAREAASEGVNVIFAPMVDITRDPRWGRVAEGAGEDVYYGGEVAKARVRGFQRNDWQDMPHVAACPKHYVGYGASEGGRDYDYTEISEHTLRETYLPPFKAAIDAGASIIMSSFNDFNGTPVSVSKHLIGDVLRGELGFEGMVLSDWESVLQSVEHGVSADEYEAALNGLSAGVDMDMNSGIYRSQLPRLAEDGKITLEQIDEAVGRILRVKLLLGLFENHRSKKELSKKIVRCEEHVKTARRMAQRSIVLLRNQEGILPLRKDLESICVIGPLADSRSDPLGCWSCKTNPDNVVTVLEGIRNRVSPQTKVIYEKGCDMDDADDANGAEDVGDTDDVNDANDVDKEGETQVRAALEAAKDAEAVLMVLGEPAYMSGENNSRAYLDIPHPQKELLKQVREVNENIVLILMNGRPLTLTWEHEHIKGIVEAWHLGDECGNAVADVLFGDYNPSGKLTMTFPRSVGQIPIYYNRKNTGRPELIRYIDEETTPLYPFGYGLSYSNFVYKNIALSEKTLLRGQKLTVTAEIENRSDVAGEETVQLYIRDVVASVTRPVRELRDFKKLYFEPHQTRTVEFALTEEKLSFIGADLKPVVEAGEFKVYVGGDSECTLCGSFTFAEAIGEAKICLR